ncbi:hypothetical protein [Deinococcus sp. Leaf326]|uniref:hypothetical protein n=1 Tax=Deinococcus sp. Leaf326 TaxID=1736338 RepID=UPI0006FC67CC|nr:hypothetical protein [Deinococcus sp. Leaf326]KQR35175.1 hypothetical protein ASF71_16470 [Deinococcus sp. Leaf326]
MKLTLTAVDSLSRPVTVLSLPDQLAPEGVTQAIEDAIHQDQGGRVLCWQCTSTVGETSGAGEYRAVDEQGLVWFDDSPIGLLRAELAQAQARITELEAQLTLRGTMTHSPETAAPSVILGNGQPKPAGTWDWYGAYDPAHPRPAGTALFSVGVFQWLPKTGQGVKRGKSVARFSGFSGQPQIVYDQARAWITERTKNPSGPVPSRPMVSVDHFREALTLEAIRAAGAASANQNRGDH